MKGNRFLQWLKRPHGFFLVLAYLFTAAAVAASVVFAVIGSKNKTVEIVSYGMFALAAVLLAYTVYTVVIYAPTVKQKCNDFLKRHAFTASLTQDYGFKTTVFALLSFGITVAFATVYLVSAIRYRLLWYASIAAYYFALTLFRGGVLLADRKCKKKLADNAQKYANVKWQIYLASGAFLILVELAMTAAVTQMMLSKRPTQGGTVLAITNAAYTFYKMAMAIYHLTKAKKFDDPVIQSLRDLNFADACMSVVSLTVLMYATFNTDTPDPSMEYIQPTVGFVACAVVIAVATVMILRAVKKRRSLQGECENEQQ